MIEFETFFFFFDFFEENLKGESCKFRSIYMYVCMYVCI